jgi:hypothetical protein
LKESALPILSGPDDPRVPKHRTLECLQYQGTAKRDSIVDQAFSAISVENSVEINEFCGNRVEKTGRNG